MKTYRVFWEIEIEADSPRQAAQQALEIQRDRKSIATVFDVREPSGNHVTFDLRASLPTKRGV